MLKMVRVTTNADEEGRVMRTIGYFAGSKEQIASFLVKNKTPHGYYFTFEDQELIDLSRTIPDSIISVTVDKYGRANITEKCDPEYDEYLRLKAKFGGR